MLTFVKHATNRLWLVLFLASLLVMPAQAQAGLSPAGDTLAVESGSQKVLVDAADADLLALLEEMGAQKLADYDAFSLWQLPPPGENPLPASLGLDLQPLDESIYLRGMTLNPTANPPDPGLIAPNRSDVPSGPGFWMVQFIGPTQETWLDTLQAAGLERVAYLPNQAYVVWGEQPAQTLAQLASEYAFIQWNGPYLSEYRLAPDLRDANLEDKEVDVAVQIYPHPDADQAVQRLEELAAQVYQPATQVVAGFTTLILRLPAHVLTEVAAWTEVFNIKSWGAPEMQDEAQGQVLAGNLTIFNGQTRPSGPGYLEWLNSKGFPTDSDAYPIVDVVDDGIDQGNAAAVLHSDFYTYGASSSSDRIIALANCTKDSSPNGINGHGNLNAGIVGGYNNRSGFPFEDSAGFQYGLGISPYGRLAGTKIFQNSKTFDLSQCGNNYSGVSAASYANGASISSNSWGSSSSLGGYTVSAQTYDQLTRDASSAPGNQPMLHIFSAGNSGATADGNIHTKSITPPGTAKNVLTVGATDGIRDLDTVDGCGYAATGSSDDIASFSSRGPTADNRVKPDLMAPGVHIQGPASQDPLFNGSSVCGNPDRTLRYYPIGAQTLYTWSTGTSHAAPAVAGAAQLTYEYYKRALHPGSTPSPAMLKALLINSARYLTGDSAGDTLPSPNQGWGSANLGMLFDNVQRYTLDQTYLFTRSGNELSVQGGVVDPSKPFRVSLVWTDAPGTTSGNAYVNDLDLEVLINGQTYKGNFFNGANSAQGGSYDPANNVENVFLPAGQSGSFKVRVIARNIAGDGVPGNSSSLDQDFALVIYNGSTSLRPAFAVQGLHWSATGGQIPTTIEPGETISMTIDLANQGNLVANGVTGTLSLAKGKALLSGAGSTYPNIAPGSVTQNSTPYQITISPDQPCGSPVDLTLTLRYFPSQQQQFTTSLATGLQGSIQLNMTDPPVSIPDNSSRGAAARIATGYDLNILDADVQVSIRHPDDQNLALTLISPGGTHMALASNQPGIDYTQTLFDDSAAALITQGKAPFSGRFRPQQPLADLNGTNAAGTWQLKVVDSQSGSSGQITGFAVNLRFTTCDAVYFIENIRRVYLPAILH